MVHDAGLGALRRWGNSGDLADICCLLRYRGRSVVAQAGSQVAGRTSRYHSLCMTPLAVYGFEWMTGLWLQGLPGEYRDFYGWIEGGWFAMEVGTVVAGLVALRFFRFPFLTAPIAFSLWFMSMDLTPLIYGADYQYGGGYQLVSLFFGLTLLEGGGELDWFFYSLVNLALVILSVLLQRRVFIVFGSVGVFGYVGHLAWEIFEDSLVFPFVLSAVGIAIIALGILYAKNKERVERGVLSRVPGGVMRF